ncbi:MAG: type II secretion system protein [Planctomycetes bacterium]|nr:type II secretion system protein [Planctomycetota bacterium]
MSRACHSNERGFALLVMLGVIASASLALVIAVEAFAPRADRDVRVEQNLAFVERAARDEFRRDGAFPADLDALAASVGGLASASWRGDPWSSAQDLDLTRVGSSLRIRSRGADGVLGTADDPVAIVPAEDLVRVRQRGRLRLIRAVLARSQYCLAGTMTAGERAAMLAALRDYALARREWLTADTAARVALGTRLTDAETTVAAIAAAHACPALPTAVTGAGGLMAGLGLPDGRAVDGVGAVLLRNGTVGVVARGADGIGGTDDDM